MRKSTADRPTNSTSMRPGRRWRIPATIAMLGSAVGITACVATGAESLPTLAADAVHKASDSLGRASASADAASPAAEGDLGERLVTIEDLHEPAIAKLNPDLRAAVTRATRDAARQGITIQIKSGWRSEEYQSRLLDQAIKRYGSREKALEWVATPSGSSHTTGAAVDVGPTDAASWMSQHGAAYGLCQTYGNELWHYELAVAPGGTCPAPRTNAAH